MYHVFMYRFMPNKTLVIIACSFFYMNSQLMLNSLPALIGNQYCPLDTSSRKLLREACSRESKDAMNTRILFSMEFARELAVFFSNHH
ncbi:hypothetical protein ACJX0J_002937, partial [Zea mays]